MGKIVHMKECAKTAPKMVRGNRPKNNETTADHSGFFFLSTKSVIGQLCVIAGRYGGQAVAQRLMHSCSVLGRNANLLR